MPNNRSSAKEKLKEAVFSEASNETVTRNDYDNVDDNDDDEKEDEDEDEAVIRFVRKSSSMNEKSSAESPVTTTDGASNEGPSGSEVPTGDAGKKKQRKSSWSDHTAVKSSASVRPIDQPFRRFISKKIALTPPAPDHDVQALKNSRLPLSRMRSEESGSDA